MNGSRKISPELVNRLRPIVETCFTRLGTDLAGSSGHTLELGTPDADGAGPEDLDTAVGPSPVGILLRISGDVGGQVAILLPRPLAITLASFQLHRDGTETGRRRDGIGMDDSELRALEEIGGFLAEGLASGFEENSLLTLDVALDATRTGDDWQPSGDLTEPELVRVSVECTPPGYPADVARLILPGDLVEEATGVSLASDGDSSSDGPRTLAEGSTLIGFALGSGERRLVQRMVEARGLKCRFSDDVRDLLYLVVNHECVGIAVGDAVAVPNTRTGDVNVATVKRLRTHPRGRDLPVFYLVQCPERDHALRIAQLGVTDIVALPAKGRALEKRFDRFLDFMVAHALEAAA